jgi:hypothetical protein
MKARAASPRHVNFLRHSISAKHESCYRPSSTYPHREPTMAKRSEQSRRREGAASPLEPARRVAPRPREDRQLRILERLTTGLTHRRDAGEPRDRPSPPAQLQKKAPNMLESHDGKTEIGALRDPPSPLAGEGGPEGRMRGRRRRLELSARARRRKQQRFT